MQSAVGFSILSTTVVELQSRVGDPASVNKMTNAAMNTSTLGYTRSIRGKANLFVGKWRLNTNRVSSLCLTFAGT